MQAIILAAGMGKRLKDLTKNNTKCMVTVNGVTLIERMLHIIEKKDISRILIVVGYEGQKLIDFIQKLDIEKPVIFINNPAYEKTNNIYSLSLAKEWLCREDTLIFESDVIFEESVLDELIDDPRETLALVDKYKSWMDGTCVILSSDDSIEAFISKKNFKYKDIDKYYKTVNIYKFSRHFSETHYVPFLDAYRKALGENEYYEQVLRVITLLDDPQIKAKRLSGQRWYEIDDAQDLDIAESIFADGEQHVQLIQSRYGGYWRYPDILDFCYLVNPYFPSPQMEEEMQRNFVSLLTQYPSGMQVNSFLAAKMFNVLPEFIVPGNGAAELIKSLLPYLHGTTGFVRPTFEEYPNRYANDKSIYFFPSNQDYSYSADVLINFFDNKMINNLVIINPDNPSGNYIPKDDLFKLIKWAGKKKIKLIVDESFSDFSDEENNTLITMNILTDNPHLFVIKSISKSYGVPGLRLGILASGDKSVISAVKKDLPIWNINSFAEYFMQIEEKYKQDYINSLVLLRLERIRFESLLEQIPEIHVIPSQANFVMVELSGKLTAKNLMSKLLNQKNILVKELTTKTEGKNYLRFAIRDTEDNNKLIDALHEFLD